jgi:hypothetical protein
MIAVSGSAACGTMFCPISTAIQLSSVNSELYAGEDAALALPQFDPLAQSVGQGHGAAMIPEIGSVRAVAW